LCEAEPSSEENQQHETLINTGSGEGRLAQIKKFHQPNFLGLQKLFVHRSFTDNNQKKTKKAHR
jgi:hypothetical protein